MLSRGALFAIGLFALLGGLSLSYLWYSQSAPAPAGPVVTQVVTRTILVASHALPAGTLLRPGDMAWEERQAAAVMGADIVRGSASETDFVGAVTRRAFAARAPLTAGDMVKPGDRDFLVTALAPGYRAVSINVDAVQSTSGLALPGDRVDIILTQSFAPQTTDAGHRSVGETVLRNLRVIAVDQTTLPVTKPTDAQRDTLGQVHMPKTVTLEVTERQAAMLLVADQMGKVQLALRGQQDRGAPLLGRLFASDQPSAVWAGDVSKALAKPPAEPVTARAEIAVMRGGKTERLCDTIAGLAPCK
jgi:pilus assembly protein CpaB